jgi:DNA (cytosine-5)-methyltransferase 1
MLALDLYCGMGGLSLGFLLAVEGLRVHGIDVNPLAVKAYNANLPGGRAEVGDALKWTPEEEYDLVIGGSPCQPFSIINNRRPATEHPLFPTFARFFDIVVATQPEAFVLENVEGLTDSRNFHHLEAQLARLRGYRVKWKVLDAADYGVPQRRERLIVVGIRDDLGVQPEFPRSTHAERESLTLTGERLHRHVTLGEAIADLLDLDPPPGCLLTPRQVERIRRERANASGIHWGTMEFPDRLDRPCRTISSHTVEGSKRETIVLAWRRGYRRLTVKECLRIQTFPDWWTLPEAGEKALHRLVGEAVPPVFAYRLACALARSLGWRTREPPKPEEWMLPFFERAFADYRLSRDVDRLQRQPVNAS